MAEPTSTPCRGRIVDYRDESGTIETSVGTRIRFGRSSCSGFTPAVGLEVWVMTVKVLPVLGERASLVNLTGADEAADPAARARGRYEQHEQMIRQAHAASEGSREALRPQARMAPLPDGWHPCLQTLASVLPLPAALGRLPEENPRSGCGRSGVSLGTKVSLAAAGLVASRVAQAPGGARRLAFGRWSPWPAYDPCLVPFAQLDGEEPDVVALFFHPELHARRGALPVVYWRHDDRPDFLSADPLAFLAAVRHGRLAVGDEAIAARPDVAASLGLPDPGAMLRCAPLPDWLAAAMSGADEERRLVRQLTDASLGNDWAGILDLSEALEREYERRRWPYQVLATRFQRRELFQ